MNCKSSKTSDPHRLLLNLTDKIGLRRKDEYIPLSWNEEFDLPDGSYSRSYIRYSRLFLIYNICTIIYNIWRGKGFNC